MTTHPTDETPGTPRTDAAEFNTDDSLQHHVNVVVSDFARTLETELNEVTKALDFNTRTLADFGKEVARLTALLRQKDEALREWRGLLINCTGPDVPDDVCEVVRRIVRAIDAALTPKSPTP